VRDYGRFDRREAPQFYPDVKGRHTCHAEPAQQRQGPSAGPALRVLQR
jgi:hypothetical protein